MSTEKQKRFLIHTAFFGIILLGVYLCCRYLLSPLTPFIIGFFIAWALHKPSKAIARRMHIKPRLPALVLTIVFYIIVGSLISLAGVQIVSALRDFLPKLPSLYTDTLFPFIETTLDNVEAWLQQYDPATAAKVETISIEVFSAIESALTNLSSSALKGLSSFITSIPNFIMKIILTVVATFFCSLDFEKIIGFFKRKLPLKFCTLLTQTVRASLTSIRKIIQSYILIMIMSFVELSIGFIIMRIPYAVGIALLVAVIDILPILGTGAVLIPWAIIAFVMKNIPLGVGMALLYIIMLIVRNVVEPKLVGKQIGLHPLVTLMSMIVGLNLFGLLGMLLCPIALSMLMQMIESGSLPVPKWKNSETCEK